ncbi:MAG: hypothetical protein DCC58_20905 [Chloroflexi bacterium]|nr:MAG: hypothetical protein DCC58_20905 [Chloroflexota bacterium]
MRWYSSSREETENAMIARQQPSRRAFTDCPGELAAALVISALAAASALCGSLVLLLVCGGLATLLGLRCASWRVCRLLAGAGSAVVVSLAAPGFVSGGDARVLVVWLGAALLWMLPVLLVGSALGVLVRRQASRREVAYS